MMSTASCSVKCTVHASVSTFTVVSITRGRVQPENVERNVPETKTSSVLNSMPFWDLSVAIWERINPHVHTVCTAHPFIPYLLKYPNSWPLMFITSIHNFFTEDRSFRTLVLWSVFLPLWARTADSMILPARTETAGPFLDLKMHLCLSLYFPSCPTSSWSHPSWPPRGSCWVLIPRPFDTLWPMHAASYLSSIYSQC